MRLSLILIAILISACGKRLEDGYLTCPESVRNQPTRTDPTIIPYIANYFRAGEEAKLKTYQFKNDSYGFDNYVLTAEFNQLMSTRAQTLSRSIHVYFESRESLRKLTGNPYVGVCWRGCNKVAIDQDSWKGYSDEFRNLLITHELGHCHLKMAHTDQNTNHIMNPELMPEDVYKEKKDQYDKTFFTCNTKPPCI